MRKRIKISKKAGLSPGTLLHVGAQKTQKDTIDIISFNKDEFIEKSSNEFETISSLLKNENVNWLNIDGLHNVDLIEKTGKFFNLHPLNVEDILNTQHRPKMEEHEEHLFFTLKMVNSIENDLIDYDHISIILGKNFVLTFQEKENELFRRIKESLRSNGALRKRNADYLFYRLLDTIVDSYYVVLDSFNDRIELLEDKLQQNLNKRLNLELQYLKKDLIAFRKSIYPVREAVGKILKEEPQIIDPPTLRYFSDVYDHIIHVAETLETMRDLSAGLSDIYVTTIDYKMNEVIKVLTIISTIFMPLTFIVGLYGMNFEYMPELHWKLGYPMIILLMIILALGMIFYMKRKKWF